MKVREKSISYAIGKKRQAVNKESILEEKILSLEKELARCTVGSDYSNTLTEELDLCKKELKYIIQWRTQGAILRCKARWYNEGEKHTKYFLSLERRHCKLNTISQLQINENEFATSDSEILSECETFYKTLYTSQGNTITSDNEFFQLENVTSVDENDSASCEGLLTTKECLNALKDMDSGKTPGTDGLQAEFYKTFWDDLAPSLIALLNYAYKAGTLLVFQRRGVIKLIPKKDTNPHLIKNWRPLTLLNCDYKIATKAITNRIKSVISQLINNDQTGFLKGRFIGENIRLIDSVINHTAQQEIPGLLRFIGLRKSFRLP